MITIRFPSNAADMESVYPDAFFKIGHILEVKDSDSAIQPMILHVVGVHPDSISCEKGPKTAVAAIKKSRSA